MDNDNLPPKTQFRELQRWTHFVFVFPKGTTLGGGGRTGRGAWGGLERMEYVAYLHVA